MLYYFKAKDGNEYGPISEEEIKDWKDHQGRMNNESLVRAENSDEWVPLGKMSKLGSAPCRRLLSVLRLLSLRFQLFNLLITKPIEAALS
jgi:hypothetical protein